MLFLDSSFFEITRYITHPISLIAYVCALITYYFVSKNISDRKKLAANPEAYIATAERLHINLEIIPKNERAKITLQMLKNRIIGQIILAISIIVIGIIIAYVSINYLQNKSPNENFNNEHVKFTDSAQNKSNIYQQHTGSGDNVGRDKIIKK